MCGISTALTLESQTFPATKASEQSSSSTSGTACSSIKNGTHVILNAYEATLEKEIDASLDRIAHRGPDARGIWLGKQGKVALGHCRLSIVDLSSDGDQPFHSPDDTIHCVVNGEIYDYDRIRAELIRDFGYKFKGHSDCEVVVALYKHFGLSFINQLRGEFAICLYDEVQELFIAARDRYGIKPLFWTVVDGKLLVASEMKAFLPLGWKPEWDVRSLVDAGWAVDSRTIFKNVQKVRPGHYLICTSFRTLESRQYWDMDYPDKNHIETRSEEEMIAGVRERLLEAVRLRLRADVPVGIYLSGGIDSSAVAGMVTHLVKEQGTKAGSQDIKEKVCSFTIAFDENSGYDESAIATRTAQWLGIKNIKKHMDEAETAKYFEDATYHCEHSNFDLNYVGKFALSEITRDNGFKVVLTGEGSDEHFAGYIPFIAEYLREPDAAWPHTLLSSNDGLRRKLLLEREIASQKFLNDFGAKEGEGKSSSTRWQLNNSDAGSIALVFRPLVETFSPWVQSVYGDLDPRDTITNNLDGRIKELVRKKWHPLHTTLYAWNKSGLVNNLLSCLGDRVEMGHSVEARTPFLDHHLTEYVNAIPPSLKVRCDNHGAGAEGHSVNGNNGSDGQKAAESSVLTEKWILREATRPFITDEIFRRRKHPYTAPVIYQANGPLHKLFQKTLTKENVERLGFLSWDAINSCMEQAFPVSGKPEVSSHALRAVFMGAQWVILGQRFGVKRADR